MEEGELGKERWSTGISRVIEIDKDKGVSRKGQCLARRGGSLTQRAMRIESQVPLIERRIFRLHGL